MSRSDKDDYADAVVASWTDTHKKGALMLLVLLALYERPAWSAELTEYITSLTDGHISVDPQSLHRSLRRLVGLNLITFTEHSVTGTGAKRKTYELTHIGEDVLGRFARRTLSYARNPRYLRALDSLATSVA
jgi:DNA-binding PadR family transcriptional regulator